MGGMRRRSLSGAPAVTAVACVILSACTGWCGAGRRPGHSHVKAGQQPRVRRVTLTRLGQVLADLREQFVSSVRGQGRRNRLQVA
jgi:hypothetical protein